MQTVFSLFSAPAGFGLLASAPRPGPITNVSAVIDLIKISSVSLQKFTCFVFYWTSSWSVMRTGKFYEPKMICWWMNVEIFVFMYFISLSSHFSILLSLFTCSMTTWERCDSVQLIVPPVWLKMYRFFWAFTALLFSCFLQNTINPAYTPCFSSGNNHNLQTRNIHLKMASYLNPDQS